HAEIVAQTIEPVREGGVTRWRAELAIGDARRLIAEIVRGDIEIVPSHSDRIILSATSAAPEEEAAQLRVRLERTGDVIRITDQFPPRTPWTIDFSECLPLTEGRGDYRYSKVRLTMRLALPRGLIIFAHSMDGSVNDRGY
ncbi:MAG: hypothetical protein ACREB5_07030, partial [Sphingomonadaceae bacterium]